MRMFLRMTTSPSPQHEALHRVFFVRRKLLSRMFPGVGELADDDIEEISPDYNAAPEVLVRHGDSALLTELFVSGTGGRCVVVIEAQTSSDKHGTRFRWPYYAAFLFTKYRRPVVFAVVTNDAAIARSARVPIEIGPPQWPWMSARPTVFGPDTEPVITEVAVAERDIDAAIFSALVHSRSEQINVILEALHVALSSVDPKTIAGLVDFIESGLGDTAARTKWRQLMKTSRFPYVSEVRAEAYEKGYEEACDERHAREAKLVEQVLDKRGITMMATDRERIISCRDEASIDAWLDRMITVTTIAELFDDAEPK